MYMLYCNVEDLHSPLSNRPQHFVDVVVMLIEQRSHREPRQTHRRAHALQKLNRQLAQTVVRARLVCVVVRSGSVGRWLLARAAWALHE